MNKKLFLISTFFIIIGCATSQMKKHQNRIPASFAPEHEIATFWLQCHIEAKIVKADAPLMGPDEEGHLSGGPYCKVPRGQCILTDGGRTIEFPADVTCNLKPTGECPTVEACVHEAIEPARKKQDWERGNR